MSFSEDLAFALHEDWRRKRLREDGTLFYYEPKWKSIKDNGFIAKLNENELPEYVRKNENGNWEIDIANACYSQLSGDWQAENKAAAEVVAEIIESGNNYTREEIGDIIHNAWLERNSWAKGGELDVPFAELPKEEQDKDMVQYDTALKMKEAIEVDVYVGNLDVAVEYLRTSKENNENIKLNFNGHTLYSMFDNVDTCYVKVVGVNKAQREEQERKWHEEWLQKIEKQNAEYEKNANDEKEFKKIVAACQHSGFNKKQTKNILSELGFIEKNLEEDIKQLEKIIVKYKGKKITLDSLVGNHDRDATPEGLSEIIERNKPQNKIKGHEPYNPENPKFTLKEPFKKKYDEISNKEDPKEDLFGGDEE